jgi:hypothetical protein
VTLADDHPDEQTIADTAKTLRKHFPGVDFLIAAGITAVVALPPS